MRLGSRWKVLAVLVALIGIGVTVNLIVPRGTSPSTSSLVPPIPQGVDKMVDVPGPERIEDVAVGQPPAPLPPFQVVREAERVIEIQAQVPQIRLEIFSASITMDVADVGGTMNQISSIAEQLGGVIIGSAESKVNERDFGTITIRVPRDRFSQAIATIEQLGELRDKQTRSDDVTEEYIDLRARLVNLEKQESRLQEILNLGRNVEDILNVERELERVRGEIERLTGRINYLERNVAMSTISVTLTQPQETPFPEIDWFEPFRTGIAFLFGAFRGIVLTAFALVPFAVIGAPLYIIFRRVRSSRNRRETGSN